MPAKGAMESQPLIPVGFGGVGGRFVERLATECGDLHSSPSSDDSALEPGGGVFGSPVLITQSTQSCASLPQPAEALVGTSSMQPCHLLPLLQCPSTPCTAPSPALCGLGVELILGDSPQVGVKPEEGKGKEHN
ncbi:MAG: hypothetical protein ACKPKO_24270, partial [Candidatus Fonsibacter sp.]